MALRCFATARGVSVAAMLLLSFLLFLLAVTGSAERHVTVGKGHACFIVNPSDATNAQKAYCVGTDSGPEVDALLAGPFHALAAGDGFTCGLLSTTHRATCWTAPGVSSQLPAFAAALTASTTLYLDLASGLDAICGLRFDGVAECFTGTTSTTFGTRPPAGKDVPFASLSVGESYVACGVTRDGGEVFCWPLQVNQASLQLFPQSNIPKGPFIDVSVGSDHACALRCNGSIACWGNAARFTPLLTSTFVYLAASPTDTCGIDATTKQTVCVVSSHTSPAGTKAAEVACGTAGCVSLALTVSPSTGLTIARMLYPSLTFRSSGSICSTGSTVLNPCPDTSLSNSMRQPTAATTNEAILSPRMVAFADNAAALGTISVDYALAPLSPATFAGWSPQLSTLSFAQPSAARSSSLFSFLVPANVFSGLGRCTAIAMRRVTFERAVASTAPRGATVVELQTGSFDGLNALEDLSMEGTGARAEGKPGVFPFAALPKASALQKLRLGDNGIRELLPAPSPLAIAISLPKGLEVWLDRNQFQTLDTLKAALQQLCSSAALPSSVCQLDLSYNNITSVPSGAFTSGFESLDLISLQNNNLAFFAADALSTFSNPSLKIALTGGDGNPISTKPCKAGYYNEGSSILNRLGNTVAFHSCRVCPVGSSCVGDGKATPCPAGTYAKVPGSTSCRPCPSGFSTEVGVTGASSIVECSLELKRSCSAGFSFSSSTSTCSRCSAGFYAADGDAGCSACPRGKYQLPSALVSNAASCTSCPVGRFSSTLNATSASTCMPCPSGFDSSETRAGCVGVCPRGSVPVPSKTALSGFACDSSLCTQRAGIPVSCLQGTTVPLPRATSLVASLNSWVQKAAELRPSTTVSSNNARFLTATSTSTAPTVLPHSTLTLDLQPPSGANVVTTGGGFLANFSADVASRAAGTFKDHTQGIPPGMRDFLLSPFSLIGATAAASFFPLLILFIPAVQALFDRIRVIDLFSVSRPLDDGDEVKKFSSPLGVGITVSYLFGMTAAAAVLGLAWWTDNAQFSSGLFPLLVDFPWQQIPTPLEVFVAFAADPQDASCQSVTMTSALAANQPIAQVFTVTDTAWSALAGAATLCVVRLQYASAIPQPGGLIFNTSLSFPLSAQTIAFQIYGLLTPSATLAKLDDSAGVISGVIEAGNDTSPAGISSALLDLDVLPMLEEDELAETKNYGLIVGGLEAVVEQRTSREIVPGGAERVVFSLVATPLQQKLLVTVTERSSFGAMLAGAVGLLSGIEGNYILIYAIVYRIIRKAWGQPSWEKEALANKERRERNEKNRRPSGLKQLLSFGNLAGSPATTGGGKKPKVALATAGRRPPSPGIQLGGTGISSPGSAAGVAEGADAEESSPLPVSVLLPARRKSINFGDVFATASSPGSPGSRQGSFVGPGSGDGDKQTFSHTSPLKRNSLASLSQKPKRPSVAFPGLSTSPAEAEEDSSAPIVSNGFKFSRRPSMKMMVAGLNLDGGDNKAPLSPVASSSSPVPTSPVAFTQRNPLGVSPGFGSDSKGGFSPPSSSADGSKRPPPPPPRPSSFRRDPQTPETQQSPSPPAS